MAKKLNKNLVVGLTLTGMLIVIVSGVLAILQLPAKSPKEFVRLAEEMEKQAKAKEAEGKSSQDDIVRAAAYYQRAAGRAKMNNDNPEAARYLTKAGDLFLSTGDSMGARKAWDAAARLDPTQLAPQERMVKFSIEIAEMNPGSNKGWIDLQGDAQRLLDAAEKSKNVSYVGLYALGRSLIAQREAKESNFAEGEKKLIEAVNGDKGNPEYARALATCYLQKAKIEADKGNDATQLVKDALEVLNTAIANAPKDSEQQAKAYLARGQLYSLPQAALIMPGEEADKKAIDDLTQAVQLAPRNEETGVGLGVFYLTKLSLAQDKSKNTPPARIEEYRQKAQDTLTKAIQGDPTQYLGYLRLAALYLDDKQFDKAIKVLDERLKLPVNREGYQAWRNREYVAIIRETSFKAHLAKLSQVSDNAKSAEEVKTLQAPILARLEDIWKETKAELGDQSSLAKFMEGRLYFVKGDMFGAGTALSKAAQLTTGENPDIEYYLAIVYLRTNAPGAAEKSIGIVLSRAQQPNAAALLIQAAVKNQLNKPQEAIYAADKALAIIPNSVEAIRIKIEANSKLQNYDEVRRLSSLINPGGDKARQRINDALILQQEATQTNPIDEKKLDQAAGIYREILKTDPANGIAFPRLVSILARKKELAPEAAKVVDDARAAVEKKFKEVSQSQPAGDSAKDLNRTLVGIDLYKIDLDSSLAGEDKAKERLKRKEAVIRTIDDPFTEAMMLFQFHRDNNLPDEALRDLKEARRIKPDDPLALESMLQMAIAAKDWNLAEEVTTKAVASGLEKSSGHIYRGQILLAKENYPEAEREFRAALVELPDFAECHAQLGRALLAQQKVADAKASFNKALQLNPRNAYGLLGMAIIASTENNEVEKQRYFALASEVAPNNAWIQSEMQLQYDQANPQQAIARREQIRKQNPKDLNNLVRLAELYRSAGNLNAASQPFEEAIKTAPDDLNLVASYAQLIMSRQPPTQQDVKTARSLFEKVIKDTDPKNVERKGIAQLLLANFLAGVSRVPGLALPTTEVDQAFEDAAKTSPSFNVLVKVGEHYLRTQRVPQAIKWLRQARDGAQAAGKKQETRTAHQLIIESLLGTITPAAYDESLKEIEDFRKTYPDDGAGLLYLGEFQATTGHDADAVKSYTDFIARSPENPVGYVRRGLLSVRRGDWDRAVKDFREAKQKNSTFDGGRSRLWLIDSLRKAGQDPAALAEAQELADAMPNSGPALQKLFNLYLDMKRFDGAESLVNARSQGSLDNPLWDDWRRRIAMARNDNDAAIRLALLAVQKSNFSGQYVDTYLSLLLLQKKYDDVINFIERTLPPQARNDFVTLRLASAYASKGNIPKSVDLYDKAVSTPPVDISLLHSMMSTDPGLVANSAAVKKEIESRYQNDPKSRSNRFLACVYRMVNKDYAGALAVLRELASEASDKSPELLLERAYILRTAALMEYNLKNYPQTRDWYLKILEKSPNDAITLNNLAYLLMDQLNDPKAALPYARSAVEVIPEGNAGRSGALDTLGWNLVLLDQLDEAISRLARSLELDPSGGEAHYHLAEAYYRRSLKAGSTTATADIEEAKKQLRAADEIMVPGRDDPDNVRVKIDTLADKLGVKLAHAGGKK